MNKRIWILNHYAGDMFANKGGRHYWFAKYLVRAGYEPVIFCCNTKHNSQGQFSVMDGLWKEEYADDIGVPFVFVRSTDYTGNGISRVRNMYGFYRNVQRAAKEYADKNGLPCVILSSSVHPLTLVAGIKLAKRFKIGCICEVRDLWPETLFAYSNRLNPKGLIASILYKGEKWIYSEADALIFTMEGGAQYIKDKGWDYEHGGPVNLEKVHYINNGIDLESYDANLATNQLVVPSFSSDTKSRIIYTGSIRRANNVGFLIDVAEQLKDDSVEFLIFGDGAERHSLEQEAVERSVNNIHFMGRIDKCLVPSALASGAMTLMTYSNLQNKVSTYGMSQNKLFDYLASGTPILSNLSNDYSIINRFQCGIERSFTDSHDCADAIRSALQNHETLDYWGKNARKAATFYSFEKHTEVLIDIIESLTLKGKNDE